MYLEGGKKELQELSAAIVKAAEENHLKRQTQRATQIWAASESTQICWVSRIIAENAKSFFVADLNISIPGLRVWRPDRDQAEEEKASNLRITSQNANERACGSEWSSEDLVCGQP